MSCRLDGESASTSGPCGRIEMTRFTINRSRLASERFTWCACGCASQSFLYSIGWSEILPYNEAGAKHVSPESPLPGICVTGIHRMHVRAGADVRPNTAGRSLCGPRNLQLTLRLTF